MTRATASGSVRWKASLGRASSRGEDIVPVVEELALPLDIERAASTQLRRRRHLRPMTTRPQSARRMRYSCTRERPSGACGRDAVY